ncbi:MAG: hypothetical protein GY941_21510 [Planctomycetes bacterium]|nr:hypothetical protein [Planctomycetota bacterium]
MTNEDLLRRVFDNDRLTAQERAIEMLLFTLLLKTDLLDTDVPASMCKYMTSDEMCTERQEGGADDN